jgi:hypothetical protein
VASITLSSLPFGRHTVTATYSGDVNFTGSTASVTETVQGIRDVSGLVSVQRIMRQGHKHHHKVSPLVQTFQVTNVSGTDIGGPLYLLLDGLTGGVMLMNATGTSQTHVTPGDPFIMLPVNTLAAGQSTMVTLMFTANRKANQVMFNTFVLAGPGVV